MSKTSRLILWCVLIAVLAIPAALLVGLIYLVWTVSDAVTGRLEHRTDYL